MQRAFPPVRECSRTGAQLLDATATLGSNVFDALTNKLSGVFDRLRRRGALSEIDVAEALREVRLALLDADVALPVVKDFIAKVKELLKISP